MGISITIFNRTGTFGYAPVDDMEESRLVWA